MGAGDSEAGPGGGMEADGADRAEVMHEAGRWDQRKEWAPRAIRHRLCV